MSSFSAVKSGANLLFLYILTNKVAKLLESPEKEHHSEGRELISLCHGQLVCQRILIGNLPLVILMGNPFVAMRAGVGIKSC